MPIIGGKPTRFVILGLIILGVGVTWGACRFAPKRLLICEVQGMEDISPYLGKKVALQGLVSFNIEGQIPAGFFLVDQNCPVEEGGSKGIFVQQETSGKIVHRGDEVLVEGLVQEAVGETRILSDSEQMEILTLGNDLPPGINLAEEFFHDPDTFHYENWEGMLVSFPEGQYLEGFIGSDLPRILPIFDLDSSLQMVCLQNQSITFQLSNVEELIPLENLSNGDLVQNLTGILRQNTNGYLLELIAGSDYKVAGGKTSPGLGAGDYSSELDLTGTKEIFTPEAASGTPLSSPTITFIPAATIIPSVTYYPVNLLISELYPNPNSKEPDGEWIEIYNPQSYAQPLTGVKLGDETSSTGKEGMVRFPDGYYIESREVLVIAHQAKTFLMEFGFLPDFELEDSDARIPDLLPYDRWGRSGVQFSNSGDQVLLLDPWDGIVDLLVYGSSTGDGFSEPPPAPKEGHSLERYPPESDRNRGGDWREREQPSPGRLDRSLPTQSATLTLEPSYTLTPSSQPTLTGTSYIPPTLSATTEWTITATPSAVVLPSLSPSFTITSIITATPELSISPTISPTPSQLVTETMELSQTPSLVTSTSWANTPQSTITPSSTNMPHPVATATITPVVTVTPLASSTPCLQPTDTVIVVYLEDSEILLNEIHADPDEILGDANNDGQVHSDDDEFLEFVNIKETDLDLSGWVISDSLRTRFIFPDGSNLRSGCAVVVFGGGDPQGDFMTSKIFTTGSLGLNNTGDTITLRDDAGEVRLVYQYGLDGGENQSLTRSPDISGVLPLVLHSTVAESLGALFSPGFMLDGSVFQECP